MTSSNPSTPARLNNLKLKPSPIGLPPPNLSCKSDELHPSAVPAGKNARTFYLNALKRSVKEDDGTNPSVLVPPPLISASPFVPKPMIELLMKEKKNSALGQKFTPGGSITDMEGALHTFVTPIVPRCEMVGDYKWKSYHGIASFGTADNPAGGGKVTVTRSVAMSASIQPDFEFPRVMLRVCKLDVGEVIGKDLLPEWEIPSTADKQNAQKRAAYDAKLRAHMVYHLTKSQSLPPREDAPDPLATESNSIITFLEAIIKSPDDLGDQMIDKFAETQNKQVVSLELLYNAAIQQVINEFSALKALFPQGYVYTYDPPSIFAQKIGATILNRLFLAAVKAVSNQNALSNLRTFAINDYVDKNLVNLAQYALTAQIGAEDGRSVRVVAKQDLFTGKGGLYSPTDHEKGAMLVVHNNSDAFGQNIETESESGSLDGAMGVNSSAAASLERNRDDLLDFAF